MPSSSSTRESANIISRYLRDKMHKPSLDSAGPSETAPVRPQNSSYNPQDSSALCQLPRELLLQVISYAPGLHSINLDDSSNPGSAEGQLDDDTLKAQHGFLSLFGSCRFLLSVMQDVGSMETLFVLRHTGFFSALKASVKKSPSNTPSLLTLSQIKRIVTVLSPSFSQASLIYDEMNAQPPSLFESRKSVKPKSFVTTAEPIFPRLRSVILASGLRSSNTDRRQDKNQSRDASLHLRPRHAVPHGLQIQLAQLATDNKASYYQYKSRDHSEDAEPAWPQVSWAEPENFFVHHIEPDHRHVAQSVANSWSPGDSWVFNNGSGIKAVSIAWQIRILGLMYDGGNKSAEVYWPDPVDLTVEDKTAWLTEQQARLNEIINARGGNSVSLNTGQSIVKMKLMSQAKFRNPLAD